ncbi:MULTISPECIES: rhodanese-like domain-containing protein [Herpetosiphon]|uniref:Rhodanese domain-containing protein n=1 Tax=Herpetosiphon gulosus TaxID=1973496 RepID=A0ABP9X871_9CHLR|nr:rhodanese-like domain-containing protein [Herpetosiphon llansteffanensis]
MIPVNLTTQRPITTPIPILTTDEVVRLQTADPPLILVEALPLMHYQAAHLPGAVNIPADQIVRLAPMLLPDKAAVIAVYCSNHACGTAQHVATRLVQLGYRQVFHYQGGKQAWMLAGHPLEGQS